MKTEAIMQLQGYLDNEVSSAEARQTAAWIARDAEARALYEELKATKELLAPANEPVVAMADARDFYWSKIRQGIERAEREPAAAPAHRPWWVRLLAPVAGAAALALFVLTSVSFHGSQMATLVDETNLENGTITFHSKDRGMTIVWISSGASETAASTWTDEDEE